MPAEQSAEGAPGSGQEGSDNVSAVASGEIGISSINSVLMGINPMDVDRIEILKSGATAAAYGMRGGNGVIAIYTKSGPKQVQPDPRLGVDQVELPGFLPTREFYTPEYEAKKESNRRPDVRSTLYWNPKIITDKQGRASIIFYNNDDGRNVQIVIQGITEFGQPIHFEQTAGALMSE